MGDSKGKSPAGRPRRDASAQEVHYPAGALSWGRGAWLSWSPRLHFPLDKQKMRRGVGWEKARATARGHVLQPLPHPAAA